MAEKVFFVHLRRPNKADPEERRYDPFYEFGSFGCTKCHSGNLFHPKNASKLEGARLAFVQGGKLGSRLVFLTPPISVTVWQDNCEARWMPRKMPFKYVHAPLLVRNGDKHSDFPLVRKFASSTRWGKTRVELGLSSKIRSLAKPLPTKLADELIKNYERLRKEAPRSHLAKTYDEALPWLPPVVDRDREKSYCRILAKLSHDIDGMGSILCAGNTLRNRKSRCCGGMSHSRKPVRGTRHCT